MANIWQSTAAEIAASLSSDPVSGLTAAQAQQSMRRYGPNRLEEKAGTTPLHLFLEQFRSVIVWILIVAAVVAGLLGEWVDTLAIAAIVVLNAVLGFVQEFRAEKSLAALRQLASPVAKTIRDGHLLPLPAAELVPGDVVDLEAGDHIPADGRVISRTANFAVQEASLTGESTPVAKHADPIPAPELAIAERKNVLFLGTAVVAGRARLLVTTTGMQTELGHIAGMIQEIKPEATPLQKKLDEFGKHIVKICLVLVLLVFALQLLHNVGNIDRKVLVDTFMSAVSLAVAAIPEGLAAVVTIALALGVQRMVKRHVLIRKLPSVETLGCTTVICSDKTGTLTRNEMTVLEVWAGGKAYRVTGSGYAPDGDFQFDGQPVEAVQHPALLQALRGGLLCNNAALREEGGVWKMAGDPTEGALLTAAAKAGLWRHDLEPRARLVEELPFDSERKRMSMLREAEGGGRTLYVKGAPDGTLPLCTRILGPTGAERPLTAADRTAILAANDRLAGAALRVLAVAVRLFPAGAAVATGEGVEQELTFVGLLAMMDPPRAEAKAAVAVCKGAGIRAVMITGDHKNTAVAVGRELGLADESSLALSGDELDKLSDAELEQTVEKTAVYARVSPEHKLRIVRAWRKRGHVVAMTGDGVNDAPAIKEADIGIAMGITGTDVTKEVSDMVVTDDNFASIVAAVEEGRAIFANIRKFVFFLLSCNMGEVLVMFVAALFGWPLPLLPVQILWVNLVTDGFPALALGVEPPEKDLMQRPVRRKDEPMINLPFLKDMLIGGLVIGGVSLAAFWIVYYNLSTATDTEARLREARTVTFMVLVGSQLIHSFNCRSDRCSLFALGLFSNWKLVVMVLFSLVLQLVTVLWSPAQAVFKTVSPGFADLLLAGGLSFLPLLVFEVLKLARRPRAR